MPPERWWGFAIVWLAVLLLIVDSVLQIRRTLVGWSTSSTRD